VLAALVFPAEVIQTQESDKWDNIELDLFGLKIRNDIITLKFKIRNTGQQIQDVQFYYKDCYIMDETNQKKYFLLKDSDGQFIGGPKDKAWSGGRFSYRIDPGKSKSLWMKFPQPTDNPKTITIVIPGVMPFEEIGISK
jgi:hypothetical protein